MTALCLIKSYEHRQGRRDAQELFNTLETDVHKCNMLIQHSQKKTENFVHLYTDQKKLN